MTQSNLETDKAGFQMHGFILAEMGVKEANQQWLLKLQLNDPPSCWMNRSNNETLFDRQVKCWIKRLELVGQTFSFCFA